MLLDSNIIIYAAQPEYEWLRQYLATIPLAVSAISKVETLGFPGLSDTEKEYLELFFSHIRILSLDDLVINQAIRLRQQRKISIGDALVAATALVHNLPLITRNSRDFGWIENLTVQNPFDDN